MKKNPQKRAEQKEKQIRHRIVGIRLRIYGKNW